MLLEVEFTLNSLLMDILMSKLTVVKMPDHPLTEIPNVLRRIADEIEAGNYGEIEKIGRASCRERVSVLV